MSVQSFDFPHGLIVTRSEGELAHAGEVDTVFPLASVTKLFATWAVATVIDEGLMSLSDPLGPEGSTVRHLLSHTSGLAMNSDKVLAAPGQRRIYSNRGIEVVTAFAAGHLNLNVDEFLRAKVVEPLGIDSWRYVSSPAYGGSATVRDLAKFAREVLSPTLLSPALVSEIFTPQFPEVSGILPGYGKQSPNLWALGFEIRGEKSPHWTATEAPAHLAGHFGQSGSFLWVDRGRDLSTVFAGAKRFSEIHQAIWPKVNQEILENWG
ncbi:serine hydrolase domain-containing protein [Boudabousia marimammalium]|uniref:Beta-lactamase-related domain-containing protein n=1 Tax=Boudabousia marimammalium TaxID=156892 RepID=A0A1Q5PKI0_9ACTO|nr:serine hydrolase domain-containing protein [Boudabousia marimammalium]OKL46728.1 hypothetical protein BM477_07190 [Boudabousia marimammalium]